MYRCKHIYVHVRTYLCICVHTYMYIPSNPAAHLCQRYAYIYIHICIYIYAYIHMFIYTRVCKYLYTCIHIYTYICMYIYIDICTHICTHERACAGSHWYTHLQSYPSQKSLTSKEPYILSKEPCILSKEPRILSKKHYIHDIENSFSRSKAIAIFLVSENA